MSKTNNNNNKTNNKKPNWCLYLIIFHVNETCWKQSQEQYQSDKNNAANNADANPLTSAPFHWVWFVTFEPFS